MLTSVVASVVLAVFTSQPLLADFMPRDSDAPLRAQGMDPCNDPRYLVLKDKGLEEMTQREYEYFMLKEEQCAEATRFSEQRHSVESCQSDGEEDGKKASTSGASTSGFFGGLLLGPIGMLIATVEQSGSSPSLEQIEAIQDDTCRIAYVEGFRDSSRSRRKSTATVAGVFGTLVGAGLLYMLSQTD